MNRGNGRARVFHDDRDYRVFVALMGQACAHVPMRIVAWCVMPNHFHLVLWPIGDGDLSRWMHWLLSTHVRRHHRRYGTDGRIWQGRFKAPPIQEDHHLWRVVRYVERNPLAAALVARAERWPWSSLADANRDPPSVAIEAPAPRPLRWRATVNRPDCGRDAKDIRECTRRCRPYGDRDWRERTASELGLESSLRPDRRPRKKSGS